ncbi:flagellar basal-body MS-ring/collar protein FliF [Rubrivivax sp. JA1026]|uniref:flagellar basal-body MS-ring/collar protein FliF n=1 Tax=Rubrivivax sp. JA1026 TaxID=2710888 RepID=UPI0013E9687E|nr:flagellar basal-body MS-ring/collar protein FliF [Rubrivivax sp. JA1026]
MANPLVSTLRPAFARLRAGGLPALPPGLLRGLTPLLLAAAAVTALVVAFQWRDQSSYKPLFGAREKVAAADMMAVLDAEHVPYRVHPDSGQVLVPESDLGRVRMLLAAKGVTARLPAGLELMDRDDPLGVSQFVQDVRFRRGLEGELAQSIMTMDAVDSARVHLAIARSSSFVTVADDRSSASVVVTTKPGRTLNPEQIAATIKLVAGSVANLDAARVSVVDQAGNLLSARVDLEEGLEGLASGGMDARHRYEADTRRGVDELLGPVLGAGNYRVSVTAEVDNDRVQETREVYGADPKVTSEALRQEMDRQGLALGVPGSLSNRPVAVAAAASGADASGQAQRNASTRQYAYDRHITQIKRSRGRLERLNVAVVLASGAAPGGAAAWTPQQLGDIERTLTSGLGIDKERGDRLAVSAMPFPAPPAPTPWYGERNLWVDVGGWLLYAAGGLMLFFGVVRPGMRLLQQRASAAPTPLVPLGAGPNGSASPALAGSGAASAALPGRSPVAPLLANYDLPPPGSAVDVLVDHLKVLASKEPERVAEVVKQWVQKHDRAE